MPRCRWVRRPREIFSIACHGQRRGWKQSSTKARARDSRVLRSIEQCLSILADDPDARLISGGTDLVVESNLRSRRWSHLVSVEAIAELREFSETREFDHHRRGASAE